jgi:hypothetical protein
MTQPIISKMMVTTFSKPVAGSTFPRSDPIRIDSMNQNDMMYLSPSIAFSEISDMLDANIGADH